MNKKIVIICLGISIFLAAFLSHGFAYTQKFNIDSQREVENTKYVFEKPYAYPYKEAFLSTLNLLRDWNVEIYLKDFDKGIILARAYKNWNAPSDNFGLYFYKVSDQETRIVLRIAGIVNADKIKDIAEDVLNSIEKEIQFIRKSKE